MPKMNVKNQWPLMQLFTFGKVQEIKISFAIVLLKVTVIRFPKAMQVQVGFWIGNCANSGKTDAQNGWYSRYYETYRECLSYLFRNYNLLRSKLDKQFFRLLRTPFKD